MNSRRSQLIFIGALGVAILVIVIGLLSRSIGQPTTPSSTLQANATPLPADAVIVKIESSNTKEDWINLVVKNFNALSMKTTSGKRIVVTVNHGGSGTGLDAIMAGTSQPVVYSPGTYVWISQLNQ